MKTERPGAVTEGGSIPGGRFSNNFDFMRFAAAAMIVFAHAYALRLGYVGIGMYDPVILVAQAGLAALLVTSGYLIAMSWESTASPLRFAWKRLLRVVPALVVAIFVTLFVIGPLLTSLSPGDYLAALLSPAALFTAPYFEDGSVIGLFQGNPWSYVNGSLWTIPVEVMMYGVIAAIGIAGLLHRLGAIAVLAAVNILAWMYWFDDPRMAKVRFTLYFLVGAFLYLHRHRIAYRPVIAGALLLLLGFSAMTPYLTVAGVIAIPYLTIYVAHLPIPYVSTFGRAGDFSYGIYIYHYPVQQALIQVTANALLLPALFGLSFAVTFALAFLSWHFVEKRALAAKSLGADDLRRRLRLPPLPESLTAWCVARK